MAAVSLHASLLSHRNQAFPWEILKFIKSSCTVKYLITTVLTCNWMSMRLKKSLCVIFLPLHLSRNINSERNDLISICSRNHSGVFLAMYQILLKDTLKAFNDFKNKPQKCMKCFLMYRSMYILKVYSVHYTLR